MPDPLDTVRRAARNKHRADTRYTQALATARAAGATYAELARAAGVTRQAVRQLLERRALAPL